MNELQRKAFHENIASLVDALQHNKDKFLTDLRMARVINNDQRDTWRNLPSREMLMNLLEFLQENDRGWELTIQHLTSSNQASLAEKLKSAVAPKPPTAQVIVDNERFNCGPKFCEGIPETKGELSLKPMMCDAKLAYDEFDDELIYRNFTKPKGLALIINNRDFRDPNEWPTRMGTDVDARNLSTLWKQLGYVVQVEENLKAVEMQEKMNEFAQDDRHYQCDSAIVMVLSHGLPGAIVGIDGKIVPVDNLISRIDAKHCRALKNKPKLVIIQACRGGKGDSGQPADPSETDGVSVISTETLSNEVLPENMTDAQHQERIPTGSDILIAYATTPGFFSWRNQARGSWFVQAICEIFEQFAHKEHVGDLLVMVNQRVAKAFCKREDGFQKQMPEPNTRLRKKFFIYPGVPN